VKVFAPQFGDCGVDFAKLHKTCGVFEGPDNPKRGHSPAFVTDFDKRVITGKSDPDLISTFYVERQNLTMRMSMRRFTRLTNGYSKKIENHLCGASFHFMYSNFARPHQTLAKKLGNPTTPAMKARNADHV
jgi:IS1 family transposase